MSPCGEAAELKPGNGDFYFYPILLLFVSSLTLALGKVPAWGLSWTEVHITRASGLASTSGQGAFKSMDSENVKTPKEQKMKTWDSVFFFSSHPSQGLVHGRHTLCLWATSSVLAQCLGKMVSLTHFPQEQAGLSLPKMGLTAILVTCALR